MASPNHIWAGLSSVQELAKQSDVDECFQSVSSGKTLIANAITDKGVATSSSDTFATMANNIEKISSISGINPRHLENAYIGSGSQYTFNTTLNSSSLYMLSGGFFRFSFEYAEITYFIAFIYNNQVNRQINVYANYLFTADKIKINSNKLVLTNPYDESKTFELCMIFGMHNS